MKTFKQLFLIVISLCLTISFSSCGEDDYVTVSQTAISFDASGGSTTVLLKSNTSWTITNVPEWLSVSPTQGGDNTVVTITASSSTNNRNCSLLVSAGDDSQTISISQKSGTSPTPTPDPIVGTWHGRTNNSSEVGQLTINSDNTANFVWYDDNKTSPSVTVQYTWSKEGSQYRLSYNSRDTRMDDFDNLLVTYISASRIEVETLYNGVVDGPTCIFELGSLDLSKRTQYPEPYYKYVGVWMGEEESEESYWLCYKIINANGTGIYQEFDCKIEPYNNIQNENKEFTWNLSANGNSLDISYKNGGHETWDISNMTTTQWKTYGSVFNKQTGYSETPSIIGTWKWDYYDESMDMAFNTAQSGTANYWDNNILKTSYVINYNTASNSMTLSNGSETKQFNIALLTFNRLITYITAKDVPSAIVFKKQ